LKHGLRLSLSLILLAAILAISASAASFTVVLDKESYSYGDTVTVKVEGILPCDLATLKVVSPEREDVKVLLVSRSDLLEGVKIKIPSIPVDGWVAGTYRVDVVCGSERASATFELKARPPPPPKPRLPIVHVTVVEEESGRPIPKAVVVAYTVEGKVTDVKETNYEGKAALSVRKTTMTIVARAAGYYISERRVNVNGSSIDVTLKLKRIERIDVLEQRLDQVAMKVNTLSDRVEEAYGKVVLIDTKLIALTKQLQSLATKLNNMEEVMKDIECRVKALEEAVKSLIDKVFGG